MWNWFSHPVYSCFFSHPMSSWFFSHPKYSWFFQTQRATGSFCLQLSTSCLNTQFCSHRMCNWLFSHPMRNWFFSYPMCNWFLLPSTYKWFLFVCCCCGYCFLLVWFLLLHPTLSAHLFNKAKRNLVHFKSVLLVSRRLNWFQSSKKTPGFNLGCIQQVGLARSDISIGKQTSDSRKWFNPDFLPATLQNSLVGVLIYNNKNYKTIRYGQ